MNEQIKQAIQEAKDHAASQGWDVEDGYYEIAIRTCSDPGASNSYDWDDGELLLDSPVDGLCATLVNNDGDIEKHISTYGYLGDKVIVYAGFDFQTGSDENEVIVKDCSYRKVIS